MAKKPKQSGTKNPAANTPLNKQHKKLKATTTHTKDGSTEQQEKRNPKTGLNEEQNTPSAKNAAHGKDN